jgi:toxin ParE1/3/4
VSSEKRRIILRPAVAEDLQRQVEYMDEQSNHEVSDRYLQSVLDVLDGIAQMPGTGVPRGSLNSRLSNLRMRSVPGFANHLIFYHAVDGAVEIIRILHGAQDVDRIIGDEE